MLAYPLQVKMMSPFPSMIPYFIIFLIIILSDVRIPSNLSLLSLNGIDLGVFIFTLLIVFHSGWQVIFGFVSIFSALNTLFIYGFPVIFFWYFSRFTILSEVKAVLMAIVLCGIISGTFFSYDSIMKLGFGKISQYSLQAEEYAQMRMGKVGVLTSGRGQIGYRSQGLLERHAISSIWIIFGLISALALIPSSKGFFRFATIGFFGLMLIIGLNFTPIVGFIILISLTEFRFFSLLFGKIHKKIIQKISTLLFLSLMIFFALITLLNQTILNTIVQLINYQIKLVFTGTESGASYFGYIYSYLNNFINQIIYFPPILLIGEGFSGSFGMPKGGDIGFMETMARLGIPFFIISVFGVIKIIIRIYKHCLPYHQKGYFIINELLIASVGFLFIILFSELHYTVWTNKSVLPILFISFGLIKMYDGNGKMNKEWKYK